MSQARTIVVNVAEPRKKRGCIATLIGVFGVLFLIGLIASLFVGDPDPDAAPASVASAAPATADPDPEPGASDPLPSRDLAPLVPSRSWTRSADGRTLDAAALHVRAGAVVLADPDGRWHPVPVADLIDADQVLLREAMSGAPAIPVGHLIGADRARALLLLGPPAEDIGDYLHYLFPQGNGISLRFDRDQLAGWQVVSWTGDFPDLLPHLGLGHAALRPLRGEGPLQTARLSATNHPPVAIQATTADEGWGPVVFTIDE